MPKTSGSTGDASFTLALMRVERGLRRLTWVATLLVGLAVGWAVYRATLSRLKLEAAILSRSGQILLPGEGIWESVITGVSVGALAALIPWVVFFVGRWVVRGFREDG